MADLFDHDRVDIPELQREVRDRLGIVELGDPPTFRGRQAVEFMIDALEDIANGGSPTTVDWEDAAIWAMEVEEDYHGGGVL